MREYFDLLVFKHIPISLRPGEEISFTGISNTDKGYLEYDKSGNIECFVNEKKYLHTETIIITAHANYTIKFRNSCAYTRIFYLRILPIINNDNKSQNKMVEKYSPENLKLDEPLFLNFDYYEIKEYVIKISEYGIYRFETLGRLHTSLSIRGKIQNEFSSAVMNSAGGNAMINVYLKPGEYRISLKTLDGTAGRCGISAIKNIMIDAGICSQKKQYNFRTPAFSAISYLLNITDDSEYYINIFGKNKKFKNRLEDSSGWPLLIDEFDSMIIYLNKGEYTLISLPNENECIRIFKYFYDSPKSPIVTGRGPHRLEMNSHLKNIWYENPDTMPRDADVYLFSLAAYSRVTFLLNNQMQGKILDSKTNEEKGFIDKKKGFSGYLPAGLYKCEIQCAKFADKVPYTFSNVIDELIESTFKTVSFPCAIPVNIENDGDYEIYSAGNEDIKAELLDSDGNICAFADDQLNDWNFRIAKKILKGKYNLNIRLVGENLKANEL